MIDTIEIWTSPNTVIVLSLGILDDHPGVVMEWFSVRRWIRNRREDPVFIPESHLQEVMDAVKSLRRSLRQERRDEYDRLAVINTEDADEYLHADGTEWESEFDAPF